MKMSYFRFAALLMICAAAAISCNKGGNQNNPGGKDNPGGGEGEDVSIVIDGEFDDWANVTAEDDYCVVGNPAGDAKKVKVVKATSDDTFLYFYTEVSVDVIQHSESAHTGGNSNDGHGDSTPGPLYVYFDADNNADTGFYPHIDSQTNKPLVEGLGCEMGFELYLFISTKAPDKGAQLGWSQVVIAPTKDAEGNAYNCDGDFYQQGDWWSLKDPEGGWDPNLDNIAPSFENMASTLSGGVAKIEFAIQKDVLPIAISGSTVSFGVVMANGSETASWGQYTGIVGPLTLELQ